MSQLYYTKNIAVLNFASGATTHTEGPLNLNGVGAITLVCPAEFNGDTLTLQSSVTGDTGFTITAATGQNRLTAEQTTAIATMRDLRITTNNATGGAASMTVMMLGG
jgi:hypothetical protein